MAATGACPFAAGFSPVVVRSRLTPLSSSSSSDKVKPNPIPKQSKRFAISTEQISAFPATEKTTNGSLKIERLQEKEEKAKKIEEKRNPFIWKLAEEEMKNRKSLKDYSEESYRKSLKDYFEESKEMIRSDGGPPRWFSPLECGSRSENSPLLLYLPGIDGVGLGLVRQHYNLGKFFDIWCLHIPVKDRTSFTDLVKMVERTVRSQSAHSPRRPIYLVGECLGACLALAVAALVPDIDLVLILANPGTSFKKSQLASLTPLLAVIPDEIQLRLPYLLSLITGNPLKLVLDNVIKGVPLQHTVEELSQDVAAMSSHLSLLGDIFTRETLLRKLQLLKSASEFANSRLHAVNAQTLILSSGMDKLLPSQEEGQRLKHVLPKCENRWFHGCGHFLFLEEDFDLLNAIKGACFYRRGAYHDYISDYIRPSLAECRKIDERFRFISHAMSPVMLSTLEDGKIVRSLAGVPSEGPVLFVGHHMLLALDLYPMVPKLFLERNILMRGIAHPSVFMRLKEGLLPPISQFDFVRVMGAVPVSGTLMYKLLSSKAHVLLYPGGIREACHRKGEEYKLFWPEHSEFVRMAARFGTKIVPFGVVGQDDIIDIFLDYDDQMKVPLLRDYIQKIAEESESVRNEEQGEVGNQDMHVVGVLPKLPGRLYYYFGKPIETEGRKKELKDREKAHELYLEIKSEVEKCLNFLKEKRESDPYRNLLPRLAYQANHGFNSEVPTFEL